MTRDTLLDVRNLRTEFLTTKGPVSVIRNVSFALRAGEVMGLVGESGSGKSVTGFSIMGLVDPPGRVAEGEVLFKGQDLRSLTEPQLRQVRGNRISMIFQDPMMTLNPVLRIGTQMIETVRAHRRCDHTTARRIARDTLGIVGIPSPEERLAAYPMQFSGGMRQRVAIAIALLHEPDVIIADEPTTALDVTIQAQILSVVQRLCRERGTALVWITHDLSVVAGLAEKVAVMYAGRIVEQGSVGQIFRDPRHPYTRGLIASLPGAAEGRARLRQIPGTTPQMSDLPQGCPFRPRCLAADDACLTNPSVTCEGERLYRCYHPQEGAVE